MIAQHLQIPETPDTLDPSTLARYVSQFRKAVVQMSNKAVEIVQNAAGEESPFTRVAEILANVAPPAVPNELDIRLAWQFVNQDDLRAMLGILGQLREIHARYIEKGWPECSYTNSAFELILNPFSTLVEILCEAAKQSSEIATQSN